MSDILQNYLSILTERKTSVSDNTILYHGSKIQNLKEISPEMWVDALKKEHMKTTWASWDKSFASMFCIDWRYDINKVWLTNEYHYYTVELPWWDKRSCSMNEKWDKENKRDHCKDLKNNWKWVVSIPIKYKHLIEKPCSLYRLKGSNWIIPKKNKKYDWEWPEAYSKQPAKVLQEVKYSSVKEAYKKNNIILFVEDIKFKKSIWDRIFSKLKT